MQITWLTAFLDAPSARFEQRTRFWLDITGWTLSPFRGEGDQFATLQPATGDAMLRVQRIGDGPGRVHLDLHVDSIPEAAERAQALGARQIVDLGHRIMSSPAGMTFCLVNDRGESRRPDPREHTPPQRIDHVCVDVPAHRFADDAHFWTEFTGWSLRPTSYDEFLVVEQPAHAPFGLLLQRLGEDDGATNARAHLDIAAGDETAVVVARHEALGARRLAEFDHWTVLADPAGYRYCVTGADPLRR
jgi:hypothetical protein